MRLFSYVIRFDTGFAPNPYGRYCTLATCKPQIRRRACRGDWVIGVGSKNNVGNGKLVYAMKVKEALPIEQYAVHPSFQYKKPTPNGNAVQRCGDNIYYKDKTGQWWQRPSVHGPEDLEHDLSGLHALVARHFFYFGENAVPIPAKYADLVCRGRGHRCNFPEELVEDFVAWLEKCKPGQHGNPSNVLRKHIAIGPPAPKNCCGSKRCSRRRCC
jgi:hypothetical protein